MSTRLPIPGQDDGTWGSILNTFLGVSHNSDGTLQTSALATAGAELSSNKGQASGYAPLNSSSLVPTANLGTGAASSSNFLRGDGAWAVPSGGSGSTSLAGDTDVAIVSPSNGQVLTYNSSVSKWENLTAPVTMVAGKTGNITLGESDITNLTADLAGKLTASNNLSDLTSASAARISLGLGTAATQNKVAAGNIGVLDATDASVTNSRAPTGAASGDLSGTYPNPTVAKINGISLPVSAPSGSGQVLTSTSVSASAWQTPASAPVSSVFTRTGAVTAQSGDYTAAQVTNAADKSSVSTQTFTGNVSAPVHIASGLTGATAASRYVGATASGAPASGSFATGDFVIDQTAKIWVCTSSGAPGSWTQITAGNGGVTAFNSRTGAITPQSGDYTAAQVGALVSTSDLSSIATANVTTGNVSMNSHKITNLTNGSAASDAAAFGQIPTASATAPLVASETAASAGASASWARGDHVHPRYDWTAADHGLISWAFDPGLVAAAGTALATAGTMYVIRLHLPVTTNVTNIIVYLSSAGSGLTASQCFGALYQGGSGGSLVGITADQSGTWNSGGLKTMALSGGPFSVSAGDVYVGLWFNGTTGPSVLRVNTGLTGFVNVGLTTTSSRFGTANTGLTTSGTAPGTLGTISALQTSYWAAIS